MPRGRPSSVACWKLFYCQLSGTTEHIFAPALLLREGDRQRLADLARLPSVPSGPAKQARMVLLAADGMPNAEIARVTGYPGRP